MKKVVPSDPFGAASDPELPGLAVALDPESARKELRRGLPRLSGEKGKLRLRGIRVIRHKPGRRCVVEYDVRLELPPHPVCELTLIGKSRARRFGNESFRLLDQVWNAGFESGSGDGISVPEPLGVIPAFRMWFQRKVLGIDCTEAIGGPGGVELAGRVAQAAHKLHQANIVVDRVHQMADELQILHDCLARVALLRPDWRERLDQFAAACTRLGKSVAAPRLCGIHRDFYPAQIMVDGPRLCLLDFDLYCMGDPALDIGNFLGHLVEQAFRQTGNAHAFASQQEALREQFLELAAPGSQAAVDAYAILTLARHVYLSTQFEGRRELTEKLLVLCEESLALAGVL